MLRNKKIFLELDDEDEPLSLGWIRPLKTAPLHEVFFELNRRNDFSFERTEDLKYKKFYFPRFEGLHSESQTLYIIIANKSFPKRKKTSDELFSQIEEVKYLFPTNREMEYLIYAKDSIADFSVILLPENLLYPIQEFSLTPQNELYKLIQYYEQDNQKDKSNRHIRPSLL